MVAGRHATSARQNGPTGERFLDLAVGREGNAVAVWKGLSLATGDDFVAFSERSSGQSSFPIPTMLLTASDDNFIQPHVAVGGDGTVVVL